MCLLILIVIPDDYAHHDSNLLLTSVNGKNLDNLLVTYTVTLFADVL